MGLMDAFTAEDRMELKVSDVWDVLYTAAKIKADYDNVYKMLIMRKDGIHTFTREQIEQFIGGEK